MTTPVPVVIANGATRFPPSFEDSPLAYGLALFSLALVTSISLGVVISYALEAKRNREIDRLLSNWVARSRHATLSPLVLHRIILSGVLLTIVFGGLPDVLVLLAWGEASDATMWALFNIDRIMDGLTIIPFLTSIFVSLRAAAIVDHRLAAEPLTISLKPTWGMIRDKLKIAGLVLCIAVGVTAYKSASLS